MKYFPLSTVITKQSGGQNIVKTGRFVSTEVQEKLRKTLPKRTF